MNNTLDQVHYGRIGDTAPDWRTALKAHPEVDVDDDEPLAKTPEYVVGMLGFDPDEPDEGGEPTEESGLREYGIKGQKWGVHKAKTAPEGRLGSTVSGIEEHIGASKIASSKKVGSGVGGAVLLTFEDGSKGVWKANAKEPRGLRKNVSHGFQAAREKGAWELAKVVGMDDMVAPVVARAIDGKSGIVSAFQSGSLAEGTEAKDRYDGPKDLARAAIFDFVIGNEDRHAGNWLVDKGRLMLIDHGLAFPDKSQYMGDTSSSNAAFVWRARKDKVDILPEFIRPYIANREKIAATLKAAGLPQRSIEYVNDRIATLSKPGLGWASHIRGRTEWIPGD